MGETTLVLWGCPTCGYSFKADEHITNCPRCNTSRIERDDGPDPTRQPADERDDRERLAHLVENQLAGQRASIYSIGLSYDEMVCILAAQRHQPAPGSVVMEGWITSEQVYGSERIIAVSSSPMFPEQDPEHVIVLRAPTDPLRYLRDADVNGGYLRWLAGTYTEGKQAARKAGQPWALDGLGHAELVLYWWLTEGRPVEPPAERRIENDLVHDFAGRPNYPDEPYRNADPYMQGLPIETLRQQMAEPPEGSCSCEDPRCIFHQAPEGGDDNPHGDPQHCHQCALIEIAHLHVGLTQLRADLDEARRAIDSWMEDYGALMGKCDEAAEKLRLLGLAPTTDSEASDD